MGILGKIKEKVQEKAQKKQEERERLDSLRKDAEEIERIEFDKEMRKNLREAALIRAKREAMSKSGIAKLRAFEKLEKMNKKPISNFSDKLRKFSEYTTRNRELTERKKELNKKIRIEGKKMSEDRITKGRILRMKRKMGIKIPRSSEIIGRRPFSRTGFKGKEKGTMFKRIPRIPFERWWILRSYKKMILRTPPRIFKRIKKKKSKNPGTKDFITGGITTLFGTALLSSTANALNKI